MQSGIARDVRARSVLFAAVVASHCVVWVSVALFVSPGLVPPVQMVAEWLSSLAVVLMSLNLILATRMRTIERALGGLDKVFVTHRLTGLSIAALVTSHFLIVPKSVGYVSSKPVGYTMLPLLLLSIFVASAPRFPWRRAVPLRYQDWKLLHRFQGLFVAAAVTHSLLAPSYVRRVPLMAAYVYGIATLGLIAWVYRETLFGTLGPVHPFTVQRSRHVAEDVLEVTLTPDADAIPRVAGQFVFVSFGRSRLREQHPFTVSNAPTDSLRLSIKASGDFTRALMDGVPQGSTARVEGPYGMFDFRAGRMRQVWLAGGIGITPFLSMAAALDNGHRVTLVWSVSTRDDAVYSAELTALAERVSSLEVVIHETATSGHLRLTDLMSTAELAAATAYLCGPIQMRRALVEQLRAAGVPRSEIHYEEFRLR